jgi:hypothetical protein
LSHLVKILSSRWILVGYFPRVDARRLQVIATTFNAGVIWQLKLVSLVFKDKDVMQKVIETLSEARKHAVGDEDYFENKDI